ncbi:MAG: phosphotransferase family protein [Candidatus Dormibacteraceae bacterium]
MSSSRPPPAAGVRVHWESLPNTVRVAIEERLGGRVVEAVTQPGGFSPGLAARLRLDDGRRAFVKAVSETANPDSPEMHRREARILAALPASAPVPRLLWTYDDAGWVALGFEDVDGRHPGAPWTDGDLALVVDALKKMAIDLTPSPIATEASAFGAFERGVNGWRIAQERGEQRIDPWCLKHLARLAGLESLAPAAAAGETLLHFDTRADNILIARDRVYVLDWPSARVGAAFIDWLIMAPSVTMQGGPAPDEFIGRFDLSGVSPQDFDAILCSVAGYFVVRALDPAPPGLPTLRAFQAAQGKVALAWLRERLGWG